MDKFFQDIGSAIDRTGDAAIAWIAERWEQMLGGFLGKMTELGDAVHSGASNAMGSMRQSIGRSLSPSPTPTEKPQPTPAVERAPEPTRAPVDFSARSDVSSALAAAGLADNLGGIQCQDFGDFTFDAQTMGCASPISVAHQRSQGTGHVLTHH